MSEEIIRKEIDFKKFLEDNTNNILIIGVLLAILTFSFQFVDGLNKNNAGYLALSIFLAIFILIAHIAKDSEYFSTLTTLFFVSIILISLLIFSVIKDVYEVQFNLVLNIVYIFIAFGLGAFSSVKLFQWLLKKIEGIILIEIAIISLSLIALASYKSIISLLLQIAGRLQITEVIGKDYTLWFIAGFGIIFIYYGLYVLGLSKLFREFVDY